MEPTPKKRSLFGSLTTSIWRGSSAPAPDTEVNAAGPRKNGISNSAALPRAESKNASFESPAKRASESQLAARKIAGGRPQGLSRSKLSQSMSASDFARAPSATAKTNNFTVSMATPRRMPGDNPNMAQSRSFTTSTFSSTPNPYVRPNNFSRSSTAPRNLFNPNYNRPGSSTFSPGVSTISPNQSFPPMTPGKASRGAVSDIDKRALSNTTSAELFNMRIPSPPRELTGEVLAKEVPEGLSRSGSIYADEFLAHYCPPDFDDQQRKQFFCILDLRRLKYAADDVFTKKDWKINILNFAKEYEKSRSLIMLRYGLYEFKTVRASEAVKKEWKQKHGIASSDDEAESMSVARPNGSKRKAEEELAPGDSALTSSFNGGNKRARGPDVPAPTPANTKRKATVVAEADENQPAKLAKSAATPQKTPSATKSVFESIVNNTASTTPAKSTAKPNVSTFGASVFQAAKPSAPTKNIFGHLSDNSKGSGNDDADGESGDETSTNADEDESEGQETGQSDEPSAAASAGVATPQFGFKPTVSTNGTSSASSEAGEPSQGRSLFDRITRGADGQPVRQFPAQDGPQLLPASDKSRSVSPVKDLPAAPSNNTWSAGTPIKFGPTTSTTNGLFGSTAPKPAPPSTLGFGASKPKAPEPEPVTKVEAKETSASKPFAALSKKEETAAAPAPADKPATSQSLFQFGNKAAEPSNKTPSLFQAPNPAPTASSTPFGGTSSLFGQVKSGDEAKPAAAPSAGSLFAPKPAAPVAEAPNSGVQSSTLFGSQNKEAEKPADANQPAKRAFGGKDGKPASSPFPFTSSTQASPAKPLFGFPVAGADSKPEAPKPLFGNTPAQTEAQKPSFGATSAQTGPTKTLFGTPVTAPQSEGTKTLFGAAPAQAEPAKPLFAPQSEATKPLFGSTPAPNEAPKPPQASPMMFGGPPAQAEPPKPIFSGFGTTSSNTSQEPKPLFGNAPASNNAIFSFGSAGMPDSQATQPAASQTSGSIFGNTGSSFNFQTPSANGGSFNNPFASNSGTVSAPSSFNFGSGGNDGSSSQFIFGSSTATAPTISFNGASDTGSQQGNMFGANNASGTFSFGASQAPSAAPMFGNGLAPGGGTSTGTNTPFTFGGASSLATTPATGTPEPAAAEAEESRGPNADGDDAPQEQISLTEGGPGEEDEAVVYEVRAKAMKFEPAEDDDNKDKKPKSPWVTKGVGPLRLMKHKNTGAVRVLLRGEPRGHIVLNKAVLPNATYKTEQGGKYIKFLAAADEGQKLETWMLQVKKEDTDKALALCDALETHKKANEKK
ncbi:nucleoporin nup61 [Rhypophila decipiens]|uniref:Nucleoporin nup61 n=1 Tax=Rhypophila decipiens TaxID=261697 RepID=A0AAN6YDM6_9PEZI|nr:nucleoporin nup61 [Rhypophila decipiens]